MDDRELLAPVAPQIPVPSPFSSRLLVTVCAVSVVFAIAGTARFGYRLGTSTFDHRRDSLVQCNNPVADFGVVAPHASLHHTFVIQNTGTGLATITNVNPECSSCTKALVDKLQISPGSSVSVRTTLKLDENKGPVARLIWVTVDTRNRPIALEMKAEVQ